MERGGSEQASPDSDDHNDNTHIYTCLFGKSIHALGILVGKDSKAFPDRKQQVTQCKWMYSRDGDGIARVGLFVKSQARVEVRIKVRRLNFWAPWASERKQLERSAWNGMGLLRRANDRAVVALPGALQRACQSRQNGQTPFHGQAGARERTMCVNLERSIS